MQRRDFLQNVAGFSLAAIASSRLYGEERPPVTVPRATSGDDASEPAWRDRLTISVGPRDADIVGTTQRAIQAAVDYVARLGGGTVQLLPGRFRLRNAVYLSSKVRIVGAGAETVLTKEPSLSAKLALNSDWYDQEITLADAAGFQVGDGVCLRARNPGTKGRTVLKRTLVARDGNRFKLDRPLRENLWLMEEATAATLFPIFSGEHIADVTIENVTLDGNRANNENLDGNYAGCIFLQDCNRITMRGLEARNYNGDGISWQICHDVVVERCHSHNHQGLGLHPGSGSQRPLIRDNRLENNDIGIFFCWGVRYGLAEKNIANGNRVGISIGHRDTDNLIQDNTVSGSRAVGVLFRPERGAAFAPHRNQLVKNRILDSGDERGIAVDLQGEVESVTIRDNDIRETRQPMQRIGIRLAAGTKNIQLADNRIEGFAKSIEDLRA